MEDIQILTIIQKVLLTILEISAPVLIISIVVGLIISLFQAITQIQESTLTFVPKLLAALISIILLMPWMLNVFMKLTAELFEYIVTIVPK